MHLCPLDSPGPPRCPACPANGPLTTTHLFRAAVTYSFCDCLPIFLREPPMLDLDDPQLLQAILDNLQIGLYVSDGAGRIVFWNDGAERITGYMRHTVLGHICGELQVRRQQRKACPFCGDHIHEDTVLHGRVVDAQIYLEHKAGYMI